MATAIKQRPQTDSANMLSYTLSLADVAMQSSAIVQSAELSRSMASPIEVFRNKKFLEDTRGKWFFVHWKDAVDSEGKSLIAKTWYFVNRDVKDKSPLEHMSSEEAKKLYWYEKVYVYESAIKAVNEKRPLAIYVDYLNSGRLVLGGGYDQTCVAQMAQHKESRIIENIDKAPLETSKEVRGPAIVPTKESFLPKDVQDAASAVNVVFDKPFIRENEGSWYFVSSEDLLKFVGAAGSYRVDRAARKFNPITASQETKLMEEWKGDEILRVYESAIKLARENEAKKETRPLALAIIFYDGLCLVGEYDTDDVAPTARVNIGTNSDYHNINT